MHCELYLPYEAVGGTFLALKGPSLVEELKEAENAIQKLGGQVEEIIKYSIPGTDTQHNIAVIKKIDATPTRYPRKFAQIKKSPLI